MTIQGQPPCVSRRSSALELLFVLLTGAGHVGLEVAVDGLKGAAESINRPQHLYNLVAAVAWGVYLLLRLGRDRGLREAWGLQRAGFGPSIRACGILSLVAVPLLAGFGVWQGNWPLPIAFWLVLALYPVWGFAQQFLLQGLVTRNLRPWVSGLPWRACLVATVFSLAHFPTYRLMALTFVAGLVFTVVFERWRNLWAVGLAHGMLGALAYYTVLGQDPGADLLKLCGVVW